MIIQWNARGLKSKVYELANIIQIYRPDIVMINETWWDKCDDLSRTFTMLTTLLVLETIAVIGAQITRHTEVVPFSSKAIYRYPKFIILILNIPSG